MTGKLGERKEKEADAIKGKRTSGLVSDKELFRRMGNKVKYRSK